MYELANEIIFGLYDKKNLSSNVSEADPNEDPEDVNWILLIVKIFLRFLNAIQKIQRNMKYKFCVTAQCIYMLEHLH